jgi:hypothetical protein
MLGPKRGRKPALRDEDMIFQVGWALGRGLSHQEVGNALGVHSSTVWRFANKYIFTADPRCQALLQAVHEHSLEAEKNARNVQNERIWDNGLDLLS